MGAGVGEFLWVCVCMVVVMVGVVVVGVRVWLHGVVATNTAATVVVVVASGITL